MGNKIRKPLSTDQPTIPKKKKEDQIKNTNTDSNYFTDNEEKESVHFQNDLDLVDEEIENMESDIDMKNKDVEDTDMEDMDMEDVDIEDTDMEDLD